jgi:hypothetical protein
MIGCISAGAGWLAYGATSSGDGGLVPAVWKSATGRSWTRQASNGFVADTTGPLVSAAAMGTSIVAVSASSSVAAWTYGASDVPMSDGAFPQAVWIDPSNSQPWALVDTSTRPWTGVGTSEFDLTGFVGSQPLVVGRTGNQLAVWTAALKRVQPSAQQLSPEPATQS